MKFSGKGLFPCFSCVQRRSRWRRPGPVVWTAPSMHRVGMSEAAGSGSRSESHRGSRRVRIVSDRYERRNQRARQCKCDGFRSARAGRPDDPENQFHALSRKIHARNWIQSQLERIQPAVRSGLVSRRAYSFYRSGNRQTYLRRASGGGSVRCEGRAITNRFGWISLSPGLPSQENTPATIRLRVIKAVSPARSRCEFGISPSRRPQR